jgi:hypothetical protein
MPYSTPYTFTNNAQNADATQVNYNFSQLAAFINTECIQRDASVAFTATPYLPVTNPTDPNHAVRKGYVDGFVNATANIADSAVTTAKLNAGAVTTAKLDSTASAEAVTTAVIRDLNVTTAKIADAAITAVKIGAAAINSTSQFATTLRPTTTCTSGTRPSATVAGQFIWETDTKRVLVSDATGWHYVKPVSNGFTIAFAGANRKSGTITFPYTFATAPNVVACCQALGGTNIEGVTLNINSVTTTGFTYTAYNTWGTSYTQTINAWYIACEDY